MHIEEIREFVLLGAWPADTRLFVPRSLHSDTCEGELSNKFFPAVRLYLLHLDRTKRFRVGHRPMIHIHFPQRANEADRSASSLEFETAGHRGTKMDLPRAGGKAGPAETVSRLERAQRREIAGRIFCDHRRPGRRGGGEGYPWQIQEQGQCDLRTLHFLYNKTHARLA